MESFNARLRDELLNGELFCSLKEAQIVVEQWRWHYNQQRPHSSLGYQPVLVGIIFTLIFHIPAAAVFYFSNVANVVAIPLLVGLFVSLVPAFFKPTSTRAALVVFVILLAINLQGFRKNFTREQKVRESRGPLAAIIDRSQAASRSK